MTPRGCSSQQANFPPASAQPVKEGTAERRRKTKWREAETSLSLFYTETGNNVGKREVTQMSGWPCKNCKVSRPVGRETPPAVPGRGQQCLRSRRILKPLRSPSPGKWACKFLTPLILHQSSVLSSEADWEIGKGVEMSVLGSLPTPPPPQLIAAKWYKSPSNDSLMCREARSQRFP